MKSGGIGLAAVVVVAVLPFLTGCAEEEYETEVAYPQPIGYTAPATAQVQAPAAQPAPEQLESQAQFAPNAAGDYALGEDPAAAADSDEYADDDPAALTDFRASLDPYGSWVDDPSYGTVWVPSASVVGTDFTPYVSAGHWAYDDDYVWVSDYEWGWAPFHYGRWVWASGYGWEWIPGRQYAGAWVSWRYGYGDWGYVGWAPLGPTWCWHRGVAVGIGFAPAAPYAFVGTGELFAPSIGSRVVTGSQVGTIGAHTRPYVSASPSVNGRVAATAHVGGPPPSMLHIPASAVAHAGTTSRGLAQAHAFAHPSTAVAMGARAPQGYAAARPGAVGALGRANTPSAPAPYRSPYASHFGGKLGYGFRGSAASAPPAYSYRAPATSYGSYGSRPYSGSAASASPSFRGPSGGSYGGYRGGYAAPGRMPGGAPGFAGHAPPAGAPSGGSHPSSGYSSGGTGVIHGGGFRGGSHGGGFGGFHGGGGGGGHGGGGHR